jgi:hypothetical protein
MLGALIYVMAELARSTILFMRIGTRFLFGARRRNLTQSGVNFIDKTQAAFGPVH